MEINCPPNGSVHVKFLTPPPSPRLRRTNLFLEEPMLEEIKEISEYEELDYSTTVRQLLELALRYYKFKRGTLNTTLPQNNKTFYCQVCRELTSVRKQHSVAIMLEEFRFCEDCFFANKYKKLLIEQIGRL